MAALSLTLETQIALGMRPQWHPYLFIIFFCTFLEYNLNRLVIIVNNKIALNSGPHKWVKQNLRFFLSLIALSIAGLFAALAFAKKEVLMTLVPLGCITFMYSMPVFKYQKIIFQLRQIPYLKIFVIALVWALSTVLLPLMHSKLNIDRAEISLLLMERFFFVFSVTIPFDIRDMIADKQIGIKTIPLLINENNARVLSYFSLLVFYVICLFHYRLSNAWYTLGALSVSAVSTFIALYVEKVRKQLFYHYVILDGTLLFQGLLVLASFYVEEAHGK